MPLARIQITGQKPAAYKRALISATRAAIVEGLGALDERVVVRLSVDDAECVDVPVCRTDRFTLVEVLLYEGRSEETKRVFAQLLRARLSQDPGIEPSEVAVALHDLSKVDLDVLPGEAGSSSPSDTTR